MHILRLYGVGVGVLLLASAACTHTRDAAGAREAGRSTIAFVSTRNDSTGQPFVTAAEIYLMNGDGTDARRLTNNHHSDTFPSLSPDRTKIVFDSNRLRAADEATNVSDLFVMNTDGTEQKHLRRGSSATWSPDSKHIAFHASASGLGKPVLPYPGAATSDSDVFVMNVDEFLKNGAAAQNVTNNPATVDDDPDWSPDSRTIIFTSHAITDNPSNATSAEIYAMNADGTEAPTRLTNNDQEERAPSWSPDGKRIVYCCRRGGADFEICVMNADGSGEVRLTDNAVGDLTPSWSPDGKKIAFHRSVGGRQGFEIWLMNADGTEQVQITDTPGLNGFPNWGETRLQNDEGPVWTDGALPEMNVVSPLLPVRDRFGHGRYFIAPSVPVGLYQRYN